MNRINGVVEFGDFEVQIFFLNFFNKFNIIDQEKILMLSDVGKKVFDFFQKLKGLISGKIYLIFFQVIKNFFMDSQRIFKRMIL